MPIQRYASFPKVLSSLTFSFLGLVGAPFFIFYRGFIAGYNTVFSKAKDPLRFASRDLEPPKTLDGVINGVVLGVFLLPFLTIPGIVVSSYKGAELGYKKGFKWGFLSAVEKVFPPLLESIKSKRNKEIEDIIKEGVTIETACVSGNISRLINNLLSRAESVYEEDQTNLSQEDADKQKLLEVNYEKLIEIRNKLDSENAVQKPKAELRNNDYKTIAQQLTSAQQGPDIAASRTVATQGTAVNENDQNFSINSSNFWKVPQKNESHIKSGFAQFVEDAKEFCSDLLSNFTK